MGILAYYSPPQKKQSNTVMENHHFVTGGYIFFHGCFYSVIFASQGVRGSFPKYPWDFFWCQAATGFEGAGVRCVS